MIQGRWRFQQFLRQEKQDTEEEVHPPCDKEKSSLELKAV